jgi:hypothetical protein
MALALGEQRNEHIGAGHLVATGILNMQDSALNHTLESGRGFRVLAVFDGKGRQIFVDILGQSIPQGIEVDIAGAHNLRGIGIVDQSEQKMLEGGVFVVALTGQSNGPVEGLL